AHSLESAHAEGFLLEQRVGEPGRPCLPRTQEIGGSNPPALTNLGNGQQAIVGRASSRCFPLPQWMVGRGKSTRFYGVEPFGVVQVQVLHHPPTAGVSRRQNCCPPSRLLDVSAAPATATCSGNQFALEPNADYGRWFLELRTVTGNRNA